MKREKLLYPSVDILLVDGMDEKAVKHAMDVLHDVGWIAQQCGIEEAAERLMFFYNQAPELFIRGCAHGAAALHRALAQIVSAQ